MNHYLIVFGGAFIGLIGIILVFKYCLGPLLELLNRRPHENVQPVPQRISAKKSRFRPEIERFVHEEFESANPSDFQVIDDALPSQFQVDLFIPVWMNFFQLKDT